MFLIITKYLDILTILFIGRIHKNQIKITLYFRFVQREKFEIVKSVRFWMGGTSLGKPSIKRAMKMPHAMPHI